MRRSTVVLALALCSCRSAAPVRPRGAAPVEPVVAKAAAPGTPLPLVFAPPAGAAILEESEIIRMDLFPDGGQSRESVKATLASRFTRTDGGWALTQRMPQVQVRRADVPLEDPLMDVVTRLPIDVALDEKGGFVRLTSAEQIGPAVRSVFSEPAQALAVMQLFSPAAIEEQARREWEGKAGALYSRPLAAGAALRTAESLALADGRELPYVLARTPRGMASTALGEAVVLSLTCEGAPDAGVSISCEGQQVVAADRFLPVLWWLRLRGGSGDGGAQLSLEKTVRTVKVVGPEPEPENAP